MVFTEMNWAGHALTQVLSPALRSIALASLAGIGLTVFRIKSTPARLLTWKLVLVAALAMPLLGWVLPPLSIPATMLMRNESASATFAMEAVSHESAEVVPSQALAKESIQTVPPAAQPSKAALSTYWTFVGWSAVAIAIYLLVVLVLLTRFVVGIILCRRLVCAARNIGDPLVREKAAGYSDACGLSSAPRLCESELVSVPITVGVWRPTILLPTNWRAWESSKLDAVIAHEVSHVARRDAFAQQLSLLHRAIFWFSPLAWWLDRHLANLAEQASDEAALSCGADRTGYARILLGFFETLHAVPGRVRWQGVAMASANQAERRLKRILNWKGHTSMGLKRSLAIAIIACAVVLVCVVAAARPAQENQATPAAAPSAPKPAAGRLAAPTPASEPAAPVQGIVTGGPTTAAPMSPPDPAEAPEVVEAPGDVGYGYSYGYDDSERFVIVSGKSDSLTMSGSIDDAHHVEKLRKRLPGDFIWFERDGRSYVIQDEATIARARQFFHPQEELGRRQEELGKQQEALGKQQAELSKKMEGVRVNVPEMTAEIDKLRAELKALNASATPEDLSHLQAELAELQARLGESQSRAGVEQSKFGSEMGELGAKQGELGEKQGALGRQQAELARQASRQMKELLDNAIKNGTAKPEPEPENHSML